MNQIRKTKTQQNKPQCCFLKKIKKNNEILAILRKKEIGHTKRKLSMVKEDVASGTTERGSKEIYDNEL